MVDSYIEGPIINSSINFVAEYASIRFTFDSPPSVQIIYQINTSVISENQFFLHYYTGCRTRAATGLVARL